VSSTDDNLDREPKRIEHASFEAQLAHHTRLRAVRGGQVSELKAILKSNTEAFSQFPPAGRSVLPELPLPVSTFRTFGRVIIRGLVFLTIKVNKPLRLKGKEFHHHHMVNIV
jgi:hypothetical protein